MNLREIKIDRKNFMKTLIFMPTFLILFFLFDFLTKHFLYHSSSQLVVDWDWKIIAGRSLLHKSTTMFDFLHISVPFWLSQTISWLIVILFFWFSYKFKSIIAKAGSGIVLAGVFGNTLDNIFQGGVRDIFFIPWWDRGTFNAADIFVVAGGTLIGLSIVIAIIKNKEVFSGK